MYYLKSKKNKRENGITLIALAVTIIVLIILAGISITTLTGEKGIINQATDNSQEAQKQSIIDKIQAELLKEKTKTGNTPSKDDLKSIIQENGLNEGTLGEDSFVVKDGEYTIEYSEIIGWENYKDIRKLKAGEYVNYIDSKGEIIKCIVLYDNEYNEENGTDYGIQIITADIVDNITLGDSDFDTSMQSYNNALKILYEKAKEYRNPTYVRNARCVGSKPNDPDWDTNNKFIADSSYTYMNNYNNKFKEGDLNYNSDWTQMGNLSNTKIVGDNYWLASRIVYSRAEHHFFDVYCVSNSEINSLRMCYINSDYTFGSRGYTKGFRPVFTLNSNIKVTGGEGIEETPYTLGV